MNKLPDSLESKIYGQYKNWFLDYASYVILERAVPDLYDGLKPVQRRILHAMKEMDDGRFNKVANIIGQSMQYHPHGDASIGDAIVNLGQKDLLIETQGNWGDIRTGDTSAAPRYIEARLSKFALEVAFNPKTTNWQLSYDGRKQEPIHLPMKFPLLLAQGTEGIAVGLATKILPHNFCELIQAAIKYLKNKKFELYPDFQTGGIIDVSQYQEGKRGGKVKVRAVIEELDKKTLVIRSVPFGITTASLADSITKANDQGKIKIKKVTDVTAQEVEIQIDLATGISADMTMDALYAFTDCEVSISPNVCVIHDQKPEFISVHELLRQSVDHTKELLKQELIIQLQELENKWHYTSLEKIFFEEKIYKELEKKYETWERVLKAIHQAFQPFTQNLKKEITQDDIIKLTDKPVRRIYKLDIEDLVKQINDIESHIKKTKKNLATLVEYTILYYENLLEKYGKERGRKTEIKIFDTIQAQQVAVANTKLYVNRIDGFIGTSLRKDEFVCDCSQIDDIIIFTASGICKIVKVGDKVFVGSNIIYVGIFRKNDERTIYNMVYADGASGVSFAKRFNVVGITRDKEYILTKGTPKTKVHYLSVNANGEAETIDILLSPNCPAKNKNVIFDFVTLEIKGRTVLGNIVTKYPIKKITIKSQGVSTLSGIKVWFDQLIGRLNNDEKGQFLGTFHPDDKILIFYTDGYYEITDIDFSQRINGSRTFWIGKFYPNKLVSLVYLEKDKNQGNAKRFKIETTSLRTEFLCIKEGVGNELLSLSFEQEPILQVTAGRGALITKDELKIHELIEVTGWRSVGVKIFDYAKSMKIEFLKSEEEDADTRDDSSGE
ncbi:MAG: DNA gyrase/topoisomerase IV subunit A [Phycisphaerales bacterium]|nr:DNA gyrase/topoisomerase IV subunit A [Phycisphaerales bacterium]